MQFVPADADPRKSLCKLDPVRDQHIDNRRELGRVVHPVGSAWSSLWCQCVCTPSGLESADWPSRSALRSSACFEAKDKTKRTAVPTRTMAPAEVPSPVFACRFGRLA